MFPTVHKSLIGQDQGGLLAPQQLSPVPFDYNLQMAISSKHLKGRLGPRVSDVFDSHIAGWLWAMNIPEKKIIKKNNKKNDLKKKFKRKYLNKKIIFKKKNGGLLVNVGKLFWQV